MKVVQSEAKASSNSVERQFDHPIVIDDRDIPWHDDVMARFEHLCQLRPGWDGYNARSVDFRTANFAIRLLYTLCTPATPAPFIVPGVDGDLQIEWHTATWDLEIHVLAPNRVEAWRAPAGRSDTEGDTLTATTDFTVLHTWTTTLAEPAFADLVTPAR